MTRQQIQFLLRVTPHALQSERDFGIPACITIAQAVLESSTPRFGWGSSRLFRLANNPFGIKASHVKGLDQYGHFDIQTLEYHPVAKPAQAVAGFPQAVQPQLEMAQFQRYPSLAEAFTAHARLLMTPRYRPAYEVRQDWRKFAERLGPKLSANDTGHCGYSTNPEYSAQLVRIVEGCRLDDPRAQEWLETGKDPGPVLEAMLA